MCIEVLLLNAGGRGDLLRETNDKGETPIDIATALGDTSLVLRSGSALASGGGTACLQGGVDIERIMAVWERFFENAARASVGGGNIVQASNDPLYNNQHEDRRYSSTTLRDTTVVKEGSESYQLASGNHHAAASTLEGKPMLTDIPSRDGGSPARTGWVAGEWANGEGTNKKVDDGLLIHESGLTGRNRGVGKTDRQLSRLPPSLPALEKTRYCAWEATSADRLPDKMGEDFDINHHVPPSQQCAEEKRLIRLETEAPFVSSDDADLHLFQTPRDWNDAEELWLSESRPESSPSSREPPLEGENSGDLLNHHQAWVACWDAASGSVYYWNSESGEVTWNAPAPAHPSTEENRVDRFMSCVWDPQQEAYFSVDEDGVSRWLTEDEAAGGVACTTVFPGQAASDECRAHCTWQVALASGQQEFEADSATLARSPSIEKGRARNDSQVVVSEKSKELPSGRAALSRISEPELHGVGLSQQPLSEATRQLHNVNNDDEVHGFYDAEGGSYRHISHSTPPPDARKEHGPEPTEDEVVVADEQQSPENIAKRFSAPATRNGSSAGERRSEDAEFFDTKTWEDHHQLSAWVLWCARPSADDNDDRPPYYVNEETCTSSWLLPPEAVVTSKGWVRAWSEEHQARFYANHWTGRVTWDIEDLEAEGWLTVRHG